MLDLLIEAGRYLAGSPNSRLHQLAALRELDDRLLADVGISRCEAKLARPLHPSPTADLADGRLGASRQL
jgi:hypothetical protein